MTRSVQSIAGWSAGSGRSSLLDGSVKHVSERYEIFNGCHNTGSHHGLLLDNALKGRLTFRDLLIAVAITLALVSIALSISATFRDWEHWTTKEDQAKYAAMGK